MRPVDPRLLRLSGTARRYLVVSVAIGVAVAGLVIAQAWLVADAVARVTAGAALDSVRTPLALLLAVVVGRSALAWAQERAAHRTSARVKSQLRAAVLRRLVENPAASSGTSTGALATLVTRGVDALDGYFARFLPHLVLACIVPVVVLAQIVTVDWISGVIVAVTLPLVPVFMILVGLHSRRQMDRQWRSLSILAGHFLDMVAGLPTLKVFGRARAQAESIRRVSDQHRAASTRVLRVAFLSAFVLELAATLSVAVVAVGVGLRLLDGRIDLRTALVVLVLAPEAYLPLRNVGSSFHASSEGLAAAADAFAVLDAPRESTGTRTSVPGLTSHPVRVEAVRVRHVGTTADAIDRVSLTLQPGELVALAGGSGSGKTTLLSVLLAARAPDTGRVLVGDTDLADLDPAAWMERVAWLPQRPLLFAGTVADNIRFGEPDASDDEVREVLAACGADSVAGLSGGLHAVLGDHGAGLSAGQRQRVAVARVLLRVRRRDSGLVLLDEPTAHLDAATELGVVRAIRAACSGRTTVVATHRPEMAAAADRVVALAAPAEAALLAAALGGAA